MDDYLKIYDWFDYNFISLAWGIYINNFFNAKLTTLKIYLYLRLIGLEYIWI